SGCGASCCLVPLGKPTDAHGCVAYPPDGKRLATAESNSGTVHRWDTATGAALTAAAGHTTGPCCAAFSPDGRAVVSGGSSDRAVIVWGAATGKELVHVAGHRPVRDAIFSPDGRSLYVTEVSDKVTVHDAKSGREQFSVKI